MKESYGAAKQQHTFTVRLIAVIMGYLSLTSIHLVIVVSVIEKVEILWSVGLKKLPPFFPLLIKGRNLYRLKTFRQVNGFLVRQMTIQHLWTGFIISCAFMFLHSSDGKMKLQD